MTVPLQENTSQRPDEFLNFLSQSSLAEAVAENFRIVVGFNQLAS
jgi:hypothetical protein